MLPDTQQNVELGPPQHRNDVTGFDDDYFNYFNTDDDFINHLNHFYFPQQQDVIGYDDDDFDVDDDALDYDDVLVFDDDLNFINHLNHVIDVQQKGLTPARIQKFHQILADESIVGERCSICQDDIEVGRRMMRLDCDGQHVFCQDCVEGWFADHNTCPNCRHIFA